MKARWIVSTLCVALLVAVSGLIAAEEKKEEKKEFKATCPVSGQAGDRGQLFGPEKVEGG